MPAAVLGRTAADPGRACPGDGPAGPGGTVLARDIGPGDWVSLHWDWICDRLTQHQLRALRGFTLRHLELVNHRVEHPGTLAFLG